MKHAKLIHNPVAGDEEYSKKKLLSLVKAGHFECSYSSTKKGGWKKIEDVDFIIAAGGDGTIRKITKELLARNVLEKSCPIALLPLGTANNIAKTLGIKGTPYEIIKSWHSWNLKKYDIGRIEGVPKSNFFLESFGYGIFPYLIKEIRKAGKKMEMQQAVELLYQIILCYEPRFCQLKVDGTDHSGNFLLAEIMNTRSIGPNLHLAPFADPGDGEFEVVLVPEAHKEKFAAYIFSRLKGEEEIYHFHTLKAKRVQISWEGTHVHIDDSVVKVKKAQEIAIDLKQHLLEFLVPKKNSRA